MFDRFACEHMGIIFPCIVSSASATDATITTLGVTYSGTDIARLYASLHDVLDLICFSDSTGCNLYMIVR